jgi:zinc protease
VVVYGDAHRVNTDLAKLQAVTTAEIKEVMNRFITGKKKVILEYLPETMKPGYVPPPSEKKEKTP